MSALNYHPFMAARRTPSPGVDNDPAAQSKSERTRARILDAAAEVLSTKGYAGTRLTDVARVAELQAPAIYYYFDSRESLIEEVMWAGTADMLNHVTTILDELPEETDSLERIMVAVESHLRHELEISAYTTASIRNAGQIPDHIRKRQVAEERKYGRVWRDLIHRAHEDGLLRHDLDLYVAQMLILGSLNWTAEWWNPRKTGLDKVVRQAQNFVHGALTSD